MSLAWSDRRFSYRPAARSEGYGFAWHPRYATGLEDIDAMHRAMVARLDRLDSVVRHGETGASAALHDLEGTTRRHFEHEERLMEPLGRFAADTHRREHGHLLRLLADGTDLFTGLSEPPTAAVPAFMRILGRWLLHEITSNDHRLVAVTRAHRTGLRVDL